FSPTSSARLLQPDVFSPNLMRRTTEADFRQLFEHSQDGMYFMFFDEGTGIPWEATASDEQKKLWIEHTLNHLRMTEVNEVMATMFGFSRPDELYGVAIKHFFADSDTVGEQLTRFFDQGNMTATTKEKTRTGEILWIEGHHLCLYENDRLVGVCGIQRDITQRHEREAEIARRTEELHTLQSMSTILSTTLDANVIMQLILERAVNLLGADGGSLCRYNWEKDEELVALAIGIDKPVEGLRIPISESESGRVAQKRRPGIFPWEHHHREGYKPAIELLPPKHTIMSPMIARDRVVGSLILSRRLNRPPFVERDLSLLSTLAEQMAMALDNAELYEAVAASEERYRSTLNNLVEVVYSRGPLPNFEMVLISPSIERLIGHQATEFSARPNLILDLVHPDDQPDVQAKLTGLFENGIEFIAEYRIQNDQTCTWCWVRDHLRPRFSPAQQIVGYDGVLVDITERRQLEADIALARDRAEEANRLKSEFLSNISHELRTPLHGILSYARFGLKRYDKVEREKLRAYFDEIRDSGEHLLGLINDLLDLSKIEAGKMDFEFQPLPIGHIVDGVYSKLIHLVESKNIDFVCPPIPEEWIVEGDQNKLLRVFINLVGNSVKFTPVGGKIILNAEEATPASYCISVSDTGQGIPPEDLEHIFDKFAQSRHDPTHHFSGTGLGLAICREIIAIHGGRIWAESPGLGQGSTFYFTLPKTRQENVK
ncbi:MAG TPA: ATP-binding protein, partial [Acidobacteriota bacterium]|nr:ATP-binding protein [Acidobacteriota bacterium]